MDSGLASVRDLALKFQDKETLCYFCSEVSIDGEKFLKANQKCEITGRVAAICSKPSCGKGICSVCVCIFGETLSAAEVSEVEFQATVQKWYNVIFQIDQGSIYTPFCLACHIFMSNKKNQVVSHQILSFTT